MSGAAEPASPGARQAGPEREARPGAASWWLGPATRVAAWLLRWLGATWRIERIGTAAMAARFAAGKRCIFALWHARLLPLTYEHRDQGVAVLVSRSRDGERIARVVERLGFVTARGSSSRGAKEGTLAMLDHARRGRTLAITPDGPRGPAERVKPGLAYLASRTGLIVIPVAAAARPVWALRSWDRFRIPRPFARVWVGYGEPLSVPPDLDAAGEEAWRARLEAAIAGITTTVDRRARGDA